MFVYFKDGKGTTPEARVRRLQLVSSNLDLVPPRPDVLLDNLPPYDGTKFQRTRTDLRLDRARDLFLKACPNGFGGEVYNAPNGERVYKSVAHERYAAAASSLPAIAKQADAATIRDALRHVYAGPKGGDIEGLNLMHPRFEAPHYFAALDDGGFARRFLSAALAFISSPDRPNFERYASAVEEMQWVEGKGGTGLWPLFSWLPFVADPANHLVVRPSIVREFASILPFELRLDSALDYESYRRVLTMTAALKAAIENSEVNLARRPLDMIDLQSFMWVVLRLFEPGALEKGG
ncbi:MAG: hypothetical protein ABI859_02815 [Pseudomonadota bacterium]